MYISDRYEIIDKVGSGGMADVYKARCHKLNRFVAIKILKPEYSDDKNFVEKFRNEAQSAAGLSHPNIVNVYDVAEDEGLYYIVMELIEGITLKKFIERKGRLEIRDAVGIAIQIAQGMEAAHANHIIHRDIKPQNIIISREGKVKVTDFGIAKATSSNTVTSNAMGSVHYISPEQVRGGNSDEKSDIYSLGVTLYEMISGSVPFEGDNAVSIAVNHIQNEAKTLGEIIPTIPVSIDKIVQKCMQKNPERRYLTASELIADLKRALVEPDVDFVVFPNYAKTMILSENDIKKINNAVSAPVAGVAGSVVAGTENEVNVDPFADNIDVEDENDIETENQDEDIKDDVDDEVIDPKIEKLTLIGAVVTAIIMGVLLIFFVLYLMGTFEPEPEANPTQTPEPTQTVTEGPSQTPQPELVLVPTVEGKTKEEAMQILESKGLIPRYTEEMSAVPEGYIVSQDPVAGTEIEPGSEVKIVVSIGEEKVLFPNISKMTVSDAKEELINKGFNVEFEEMPENSEDIDIDFIIRTEPAADTEVTLSLSKVIVYVSCGPKKELVEVPSIEGKNAQEAKGILEAKGLVLGEAVEVYDNAPEGQIIYQSIKSGMKVAKGTVIDYKVSKGVEPTKEPEPTEKSVVGYNYTVTVTVPSTVNPFDDPASADTGTGEGDQPDEETGEGSDTDSEDGTENGTETEDESTEPATETSGNQPAVATLVTEGTIEIEVHEGDLRVYKDSVKSDYATFAENGLSFTFVIEKGVDESAPKPEKLEFAYKLNGTPISLTQNVSIGAPEEVLGE